jgi:hypothetical protein
MRRSIYPMQLGGPTSAPVIHHRLDESSTGYSFAGCSPAEPASASPAGPSMHPKSSVGQQFSANGNLSPISVSQPRGALQIW